MQITNTARGEQLEVKLKGRMDSAWSDHVGRALAECLHSGQHVVAVDMAEVDYISSAGVRVLVMYARQFKGIQGSFWISSASSAVSKVLQLSGLESLLARQTTAKTDEKAAEVQAPIQMQEPGATAELFGLERDAALKMEWPGTPDKWLARTAGAEACQKMEFSSNTMGLGLGGFGDVQSGGAQTVGEFLAVGGAVVCLPADGSNNADYMLKEGSLTPTLNVAYGAVATGKFRHLLRFDKGPQQKSLPMSSILKACLQASAGRPTGVVMVAETASLTGVCLRRLPDASGSSDGFNLFAFPAVREWLSFTTEPAFPNTTSLIVGFVAGNQGEALRLSKPLVPSGELNGHFHAAAVPYQPLRKGRIDLNSTISPLFESGQILGLLHLLNDWREISGAGESRFLRGACWLAPLQV